ncbi:MAG: hypothetical protein O2826_09565 [Chloroflexi bacterium]|nr:hypothetical protein [Chloroflexota bacterium]MDA1174749.1 hypothetical protein [Chloroflexota bacterium]
MIKVMRAFLLWTLMALAACGGDPTPSPTVITKAEAVKLAMADASEWIPGGPTPVDDARNPIAKLMAVREYRALVNQETDAMFGQDDLAWVVQLEGHSQTESPPPTFLITEYSHAVFAYDAQTGAMAHVSWGTRRTGPLFVPE